MQVNKPCIKQRNRFGLIKDMPQKFHSHMKWTTIFQFLQKNASKDAYIRFVIKKIHMQSCQSMVQENFSEWYKRSSVHSSFFHFSLSSLMLLLLQVMYVLLPILQQTKMMNLKRLKASSSGVL